MKVAFPFLRVYEKLSSQMAEVSESFCLFLNCGLFHKTMV
jgi:hypothetical protein